MNPINPIGPKIAKELYYNSTLLPQATTLNFTVENCHVNAFIESVIINLTTAEANFGSLITCNILDRGNAYPGSINGFTPITFASISSSSTTSYGTNVINTIVQNGLTVVVAINESVQDSEGLGNFYIQLTKFNGSFNQSFTMTVIYRPETTYAPKLSGRNQISNSYPCRVLSQVGILTYGDLGSTMTDQTNYIAERYNSRNNLETVSYGFTVFSTSPYFYFGTPFPTKRWFLGFSSDSTINLGLTTFSYFDGSTFVGCAGSQVFIGATGPGTYRLAYDGVIIVTPPPATWSANKLANDPLTLYNTRMIGLGTLNTNNTVSNPGMYWIQCKVGFGTTGAITISATVPLIDPELPITGRRRLI